MAELENKFLTSLKSIGTYRLSPLKQAKLKNDQ